VFDFLSSLRIILQDGSEKKKRMMTMEMVHDIVDKYAWCPLKKEYKYESKNIKNR